MNDSSPDGPDVSPSAVSTPRVLRSDDLFLGLREVAILHEDKLYRLSVTRQGKLILTK